MTNGYLRMRTIKGFNTPTQSPLQIIKVKGSKSTNIFNPYTQHKFTVFKIGNKWYVNQTLRDSVKNWTNSYSSRQWAILAIHFYECDRLAKRDMRQYDLMIHYGPSKR